MAQTQTKTKTVMKKIFSGLFLIVLALSFSAFLFLPQPASADVSTPAPAWTGLVPCGRNTGTAAEQAPCTLCHFVVGFQRLVQYGLYMVVTLALVAIFFAGVMYIVSTGDENMMTKAKGFLKVGLVGFAVVIGAWLIVNVIMWVLGAKTDLGIKVIKWNQFTCDTKSTSGQGSAISTAPSISAPTGPAPAQTADSASNNPANLNTNNSNSDKSNSDESNPGDANLNKSNPDNSNLNPIPNPDQGNDNPGGGDQSQSKSDVRLVLAGTKNIGGAIASDGVMNGSITIQNQGTTAVTKSFTLKIYFSGEMALTSNAQLAGTVTVDGIGAGEQKTIAFSTKQSGGLSLHTYYNILFVAYIDNNAQQITDKNGRSPFTQVL